MSNETANAISSSPLFKHLDAVDLAPLVADSNIQLHDAGSILIKEGTSVASLFLVREGTVRVSTNSMNKEVELKKMSTGSYFGEVSLLSGKRATATVEVEQGPCRVVAIPKDTLLNLVQRDERLRRLLEGVTLARAKDTISKVLK